MKYTTVYSTSDTNEVSVLRKLFDDEKIDYQVMNEESINGGHSNAEKIFFRVAEKDQAKARELVDQTGFPRVGDSAVGSPPIRHRRTSQKWILLFLAALIIILAAIFFFWFLNVE